MGLDGLHQALLGGGVRVGQGVRAKHDVLDRGHHRTTVSRREHVLRAEHQHAGFGLRLQRERHVHGHLVPVKVRVVRVTDERVQLNRLPFHQDRFEGQNPEAVQRGCAVEKHGMLLNHFFQAVPHGGVHALDKSLRRLDVLRNLALHQGLHDERLEELKRHFLRQTTLVQLQVRADHDDRTAGVVHSLTKQVLTEPAFLTLQHVAEGLKRALVAAHHWAAAAAVVNQGVHRLWEESRFVVDDALGSLDLDDLAQTVVAVDDTAIQVVEVRSREAAPVQLHHRAQFGRNDRQHVQNHPFRAALADEQRFDQVQTLDGAGPAGAGRHADFAAQLAGSLLQVHAAQQFLDGFGAHVGVHQVVEVALEAATDGIQQLADGAPLVLVDQHVLFEHAEELSGHIEVAQTLVRIAEFRADAVEVRLHAFPNVALIEVLVRVVDHFRGEVIEGVSLELAHLLLDHQLLVFHGLQQAGHQVGDLVQVNVNDDEGTEVDNLFELLRRDIEDQAQGRGDALEVPNVADRRGQLDVGHALASHLATRDFHAAAFAHDARVLDLRIASAVAFPVLHRTEDALTEEAVPLGLKCAVVDRFGLLNFAVRPASNVVRARNPDPDLFEQI